MTLINLKASILLLIASVWFVQPVHADTTPDSKALQGQIVVQLSDASMSEALSAVAKAGHIQIAGPADPPSGITMSLTNQPISNVLDILAKVSNTTWTLTEDGIVVFTKSQDASDTPLLQSADVLTPEQKMAALLSSLNATQLYKISRGLSLAYVELSSYQKNLLKSILSPPMVGVTDFGETIRALPRPEDSHICLFTLPCLLIPNPQSKKPIFLRLDSRPYISLRKEESK
ncbi:MAG: hypothetical protein K6U00_03870 [Armatimonadetes bacterium]|nr:hypothetical protein [Armatimonadota bacterium]